MHPTPILSNDLSHPVDTIQYKKLIQIVTSATEKDREGQEPIYVT